jgi:glycerol-3-phosphate dehydrogenase
MTKEYRSPWAPGWRKQAWKRLDENWDLIVIGGGITGAGILAVAGRSGLRMLLLEKGDFSSGTSSRSSKMIHGGLRYLKQMQIKLTRESVHERQYLLHAAPGLVEPLGFIYPVYKSGKLSPWAVWLGLGIYTHLAPDTGKYQRLNEFDISLMAPGLRVDDLGRGFHYIDAQTDDARLVMRLLHDGLSASEGRSAALNYCAVTGLLKQGDKVTGVRIKDEATGESADVFGNLVINSTGVWADELRKKVGGKSRLRPLRGSHLFFKLERFPVYQSVAFSHPDDGRPVFVYPWEGVTLAGTTDVDHRFPLSDEPRISIKEAEYLMRAVQNVFPELELKKEDVISTQAGVRPVISSGKKDPSAESRDYAVWIERGLLTVTGGKLTTFRVSAVDALKEAHKLDKRIPEPDSDVQVFNAVGAPSEARIFETVGPSKEVQVSDRLKPALSLSAILPGIYSSLSRRMSGRYAAAAAKIASLQPELLKNIEGTPYLWAELAWSAENEAVYHLDDLLLRRFRLGIILPDGGQSILPGIKNIVQDKLGWDNKRWKREAERYLRIREIAHGIPKNWIEGKRGQSPFL